MVAEEEDLNREVNKYKNKLIDRVPENTESNQFGEPSSSSTNQLIKRVM